MDSNQPAPIFSDSVGKDTSDSISVSSDDGGFVSGEEDFEPAPEVPAVSAVTYAQALAKGIDSVDDDYASSAEIPRPIAKVSDDDLEDALVLSDEDGGGDEVVFVPSSSIVQNGDSNSISKAIEVEDGKTDSSNEGVNLESGGGVKVVENSEPVQEAEETKIIEKVVEEEEDKIELSNDESSDTDSGAVTETVDADKKDKELTIQNPVSEDIVEENEIPIQDGTVSPNLVETDNEIPIQDGTVNPNLVEKDGVKFNSEGESIVEAVNVDLLAPGVVVVAPVVENKEADADNDPKLAIEDISVATPEEDKVLDTERVDLSVASPVAVDAQVDENEKADEKTDSEVAVVGQVEEIDEAVADKDSSVVETDAANDFPEEETIVEAINVDIAAPGVAVVKHTQDTDDDADVKAILSNGSDETPAADSKIIETVADSEKLADNVETTEEEPVEITSAEEPISFLSREVMLESEDKAEIDTDGDDGSVSDDDDNDGLIFGSNNAKDRFVEDFRIGSGGDSGADDSLRLDGQIVTDSEEEADTDEDGDGKFDSAALTALLKAATSAGSENGNITISAQDAARLFSVDRPAGLGSSLQSLKPAAARQGQSSLFTQGMTTAAASEVNLSEEDKKKLEKLQSLRVKFLRLVSRLGLSIDESVAAQVMYRLALVAGRQTGQLFNLDDAKATAMQLEAEKKDDLDFSVSILVLGKSGVGKSATINSIFGEEKAQIDAFEATTDTVKEIKGLVDGVNIRLLDTPGLRSSAMEQGFNRRVLSSVKKLTKKSPPDIVFYVDRLDAQTRDLNDLPVLRMITNTLGASIWRSAIVTLTHAASAPPEGPNGSPLSYEGFVTQRSHVVQQSIGQAVGDLRMMSPSLMNPVTLVENHPSCRKNRDGQKILPNGQSWRPQLLLLSYSMKILAEANSLSKPQDAFDHRKLFGFRARPPPLPYMLSSMLQSRQHPKLTTEQGGDESDNDLADLSDSSDKEDEDDYDQLPPFKPLRRSQLAKLSPEQKKAYFEEYDYRVKLLQKKQWKEEVKRMREMKKYSGNAIGAGYIEDEGESGAAAPVAVPLPDMILPPSFDSDNSAYRYRFLEPSSQFLARPVLDNHGWDHDCGYDGVNVEQSLAIANRFPGVVSVQVTKDKKEFNFNLDSSIAMKHGDKGSIMAGFDIQPIGKQLAYVVRGETKFKNLKKNKTAAGVTVTFLGENVATGIKVEDQIIFAKQYVFVGSAGAVRSSQDSAFGANLELQRREVGYPIGQVQSSFGLSIIKWRGDLALGFNSLAQFSAGRGSKVAVRAGINNKMSGQITVKTSSSEHVSLVLAGVLPTVIAIYKKIWPGVAEKYSMY
jgi:Toc86/159 family protein import component